MALWADMRQKVGGPGEFCHPGAAMSTVVFVLDVESSNYSAVVEGSDDEILVGCRCASCGGSNLRLTGSRVVRRLETRDSFVSLRVALSRCGDCRHRERLLPFDALPGKVTGVEVIVDAITTVVSDGSSVASVAHCAGVAARTLRSWILGLGTRLLDLEQLYRHRAKLAPASASPSATLHRWAAVSREVGRRHGTAEELAMTDLRRSAAEERQDAARRFVGFVTRIGGVREVASLGAAVFREAVLLFRGHRVDTPCAVAPVAPGHHLDEIPDDSSTTARARPASDRPVALRPDRRRAGVNGARRPWRGHHPHQRGADAMALGHDTPGLASHRLSLARALRPRWPRGPPTAASQGPRRQTRAS
ncbi:MAG: hypothetical protein AAB284_01675, partial [Chloroflexota bacterium]